MTERTAGSGGGRAADAPEVGDLIVALRAQDGRAQEAMRVLYDRCAPRVYGLALRLVEDPATAEEVTQDAFREVWRTAASFEPARAGALPWLLAIAHRAAVRRVRASGHAPARRCASGPTESAVVADAWSALSVDQRRALELAYLDGHTHAEVAAILALPVATVTARIRSGLHRLRDLLPPASGHVAAPA